MKFLQFCNVLKNKIIGKQCKPMITRYEKHRRAYNIGTYSYMSDMVFIAHPNELVIGKFCSIGYNVCLGPSQHPLDLLSTHPFVNMHSNPDLYGSLITPPECVKPNPANNAGVVIENDVWVGHGAIIMDGLKIGNGAVIGAGAVVTKDVEPYAIMGGVPAKVIRYRFEQDIIKELLELEWWNYPEEFIVRLPFDDVVKCIELLRKNRNSV